MENSLQTKVNALLITIELLMQNLLVIFLSNSFVTPLTYLIPPTYVAQWIQRKLTLKKFNSNAEIKLTQKQANESIWI